MCATPSQPMRDRQRNARRAPRVRVPGRSRTGSTRIARGATDSWPAELYRTHSMRNQKGLQRHTTGGSPSETITTAFPYRVLARSSKSCAFRTDTPKKGYALCGLLSLMTADPSSVIPVAGGVSISAGSGVVARYRAIIPTRLGRGIHCTLHSLKDVEAPRSKI